jgi:hypothetical protein
VGILRYARCNTQSWAGIVRPAAAERRVLGLPKPHPPLERPFPPEFNKIPLRGGAGGWGGSGGKGAAGGCGLTRSVAAGLR